MTSGVPPPQKPRLAEPERPRITRPAASKGRAKPKTKHPNLPDLPSCRRDPRGQGLHTAVCAEQVLTSLKLFVRIRVCRVGSVSEEDDAARQWLLAECAARHPDAQAATGLCGHGERRRCNFSRSVGISSRRLGSGSWQGEHSLRTITISRRLWASSMSPWLDKSLVSPAPLGDGSRFSQAP
jgi:hypothetical protein